MTKTIDDCKNIEELYEITKDINNSTKGHYQTFIKYASIVNHITEMGVRAGRSTIAFLMGKPKIMKAYDVNSRSFQYDKFKKIIKDTKFEYIVGDTLKIEIEETDLLYIDTLHTYDQLKQELERHGNKSKKYILLHDTVTFGTIGQDKKSPGLIKAVEEFLEKNKHWKLKETIQYSHGLTILERI